MSDLLLFDDAPKSCVRQTSAEAFRVITETGLLSKRRLQVYEHLYHNGPLTAKQLSLALHFSAWKRVSELRRMGCVRELGVVVCEYTGHKVLQWDVTDVIPERVRQPHIGLRRRLRDTEAALAAAEAEITRLRVALEHLGWPELCGGSV